MRYLAAELFKPARREEAWQRNVSVFLECCPEQAQSLRVIV